MEMTHNQLINTLTKAKEGQTIPMVTLLGMVIDKLEKYHELGDMIEGGIEIYDGKQAIELIRDAAIFLAENNL